MSARAVEPEPEVRTDERPGAAGQTTDATAELCDRAEDRSAGRDKKPGDAKPISDKEFVIMAASDGMFEVESSKLAKTGAKSDDVKKFAEVVITDHEKANRELMEVARKADLGVPTKLMNHHQKLLDTVKGAKGGDLDKTHVDAQLTAHEDVVALFTNASKNAKNADLKAFYPPLGHPSDRIGSKGS